MRPVLAGVFLLTVALLGSFAQERELNYKGAQEGNAQIIDTEERRVALVIGNGAYATSPLINPTKDARDIAAALTALGFEVLHRENVTQNDMKRAIRDFGQKIRKGGVGLFYYAGHGVQVEGRNYLIPVGATITHENEIEYEAVDIGFLLAQMEAAENRLNLVILDACRSNPFARAFRSTKNGLASLDAPSGTLIAYATGPGNVASDGDGGNGLYTLELLNVMRVADLKIEEVFKRVRIAVQKKSGGKQTPWESSSLVGDFYFARKLTPAEASFPPPVVKESVRENTGSNAAETKPTTPLPIAPKPEATTTAGSTDTGKSREVTLLLGRGDDLVSQQKWAEAEKEYRKVLRLEPQNADGHGKIGFIFIRQGKWEKAAEALQKSLAIDPQNATRHSNLGWALQNLKRPADAEQAFRQAIVLDTRQAVLHGNLGSFLFAQNRFAEAEKVFAEALRLDPQAALYKDRLETTRVLLIPNPVVDSRPVPQNHPAPRYTPLAAEKRIQGVVKVRALVGEDGAVKQARVINGLGYGLDEEAVRAVLQMRCKPAMKDDKPVAYWLPLDIQFRPPAVDQRPGARPPLGRPPRRQG